MTEFCEGEVVSSLTVAITWLGLAVIGAFVLGWAFREGFALADWIIVRRARSIEEAGS